MKERAQLGLFGATAVGVGAIVGGGILALAGVAFSQTGPSAMLAFALNGGIAMLTALSFAEMASRFPESGGSYTYARKVLSVEAAFAVGWVSWFASIVAAALYAAGFAHFLIVAVANVLELFGSAVPVWLKHAWTNQALAILTTAFVGWLISRKPGGGGAWVNVVKVGVFGTLIFGGVWTLFGKAVPETTAALSPFFANGASGLFQAMGYSFIALQGFDLIAAVGGEVRDPARNLPRSMLGALAIALVIYLPFLFILSTVGVESGVSITDAAAADPEGIVATAASQFLGPFGYWLVVIAAILSMYSALQANVFAASRIAQTMSRDRALPTPLRVVSARHGTPVVAIMATVGLAALSLVALPDVGSAGAASSLIFLLTFAISHGLCILIRLRSTWSPPPFRTWLFPLVPVVGGMCCLALAIFQGIAVPMAGLIASVWLAIGGGLFLKLFARQARFSDAFRTAVNPELVALRGQTPLVLVPVANPNNVEAMITIASALVPVRIGRVMALGVVVTPPDWDPEQDEQPLLRTRRVYDALFRFSARTKIQVEALGSMAPEPMEEIVRVARLHRCETVLLGLSDIESDSASRRLEILISRLDTNVVILRASAHWDLPADGEIVVPVGGQGGHERLMLRLLGSLLRNSGRRVVFLRVLPESMSRHDELRSRQALQGLADLIGDRCACEFPRSDDVVGTIAKRAESAALLVLGVQRVDREEKLLGQLTRRIALETKTPLLIVSRRG